jgi:FixJ family two-component response regulator
MRRLDHFAVATSYASVIGFVAQPGHSAELLDGHPAAPIVHIGGDLSRIEGAIRNPGWRINKLESLDILLNGGDLGAPSCLIVDISWSALQDRPLQERLSGLGPQIPFICVVEEANLPTAVALMRLGALDVVESSIADGSLIDAIRLGLQHSGTALQKAHEVRELKNRYDLLSQRERQILSLISSGLLNKQVAGELGISEITVKAHRGSLMRKMQAQSFASLVKMAMVLAL